MAEELVRYEVRRGIATITLDAPERRNALSARLRTELTAHLDTATRDNAVRVVVLSHSGPVFCSGMDLKEGGGPAARQRGTDEFRGILERIWTGPKPVVARLAGPARAGGIGMVAACDIAVAARTATFAFSEVRIGVVPAMISIPVLARLLPRAAHELFLTGETFDAERAVAIGLLNAAVAADDLDEAVRRYTGMLLLGGPGALAATKELLRRSRGADAQDFAALAELSARHFAGPEGQEGLAAFAERRPPRWVPADSGP